MKESDRYAKIVEWSEEDGCYLGSAPGLFYGGCHGDDEQQVYSKLCQIVEETIESYHTNDEPLPPPILDADAEAIIEEIRVVFRHVPHGPLSLHQAILNTWADEAQVEAARSLDSDQHWEEIPDDQIERGGKALYGADSLSWRYFIPAFMVWTLRYFKANAAYVSDETIYSFSPRQKPAFSTIKLERFETLSLAQKRSVRRFLAYMSADDRYADAASARKALAEYWEQFRDS